MSTINMTVSDKIEKSYRIYYYAKRNTVISENVKSLEFKNEYALDAIFFL